MLENPTGLVCSDDTVDICINGQTCFRIKNIDGKVVFGHPDGMQGIAPVFELNGTWTRPKARFQSLMLTDIGDTVDLGIGSANGTPEAPTRIRRGDWCGSIYQRPYDGASFTPIGPIYGGGVNETWYDSAAATGGVGPFPFSVDCSGMTDVALFVVPNGERNMHADPAYLKVKNTDYTFSYDAGSMTAAITFVSNRQPAVGNTIWVYRRYDWAMTNPFYGWSGYLRWQALEDATATARGASMVFGVTKTGELVARPRMWLDGESGDLVVAGKAVCEAHPTLGYYPDRCNVGGPDLGGNMSGAPSGVHPLTVSGRGTITALSSGHDIESVIAMRQGFSPGTGFDYDLDHASGTLRLNAVAGDVRTVIEEATASGAFTRPLHPAFCATVSADVADVTGDGTNYRVICNNELADRSDSYDPATGVFTAPVSGLYRLSCGVIADVFSSTHTNMNVQIATTGRTHGGPLLNPYAMQTSNGVVCIGHTCLAQMSAGDTAYLSLIVSGGTKTVRIRNANTRTHFAGELVC